MEDGRVQKLVAVNGMWYCEGCEAPLVNGTFTHSVECEEVPCSGSDLSRLQIAKHGKDRYPTVAAQFSKLLDESGELAEALMVLAFGFPAHIHDDDGTVEGCPGCFYDPDLTNVRQEFADVGLAYHALGDKLRLDAIECMRTLVLGDKRVFA